MGGYFLAWQLPLPRNEGRIGDSGIYTPYFHACLHLRVCLCQLIRRACVRVPQNRARPFFSRALPNLSLSRPNPCIPVIPAGLNRMTKKWHQHRVSPHSLLYFWEPCLCQPVCVMADLYTDAFLARYPIAYRWVNFPDFVNVEIR